MPRDDRVVTFGEINFDWIDKSSEIDRENAIKLGVDWSENSKWFKSEGKDSKINRAMKLDGGSVEDGWIQDRLK